MKFKCTFHNYLDGFSILTIDAINENGYKSGFYVHKYPTGNCQMMSFTYANNFLSLNPSKENWKNLLKEMVDQKLFSKIALLDISQHLRSKLDNIKQYIISEMPYTSTNGSLMCIILINVDELKQS